MNEEGEEVAKKKPVKPLPQRLSDWNSGKEVIYICPECLASFAFYGEKQNYRSRKRLYEIGQQLGKQFMQISKSTLINLSYMDSIEPGFSGTLLLKLKNECKDYVSRTYLPEFKKYLGL